MVSNTKQLVDNRILWGWTVMTNGWTVVIDKLVLTFVNVDVLPGYLVLLQILKEIRVVSENMDRTQNLFSGLKIPSLRKSSSCS